MFVDFEGLIAESFILEYSILPIIHGWIIRSVHG